MGRPLGSKNKPKDDGEGVSYHATILRNSVDGAELNAFIERVENVNQQIADCQLDRRELYAEIDRAGYDKATIRAIVKRRATDTEKIHAMDELMDEYMAALGVLADTPLGQAGADRMREAAE